jgi:hypothetical protein
MLVVGIVMATVIFVTLVILIAMLCVRRYRLHCKGSHYLDDIGIHQHNEKLLAALPEATTSTSGSGEELW